MPDRIEQFVRSPVRPLITVGFAAAFIYGFITKLIGAEIFVGVFTLVLKYWFDSREKKENGETK